MRSCLLLPAILAGALAALAADDYAPGADSQPQPNVPKGEITKHTFEQSKIFPGTTRDYWTYTPKQLDRAIAGSSSGGICAFTAAWERPDAFRRVFTSVGTYVGLRGGNNYPTLIRKTEPKPIRIFLQDGSKDLNIYGGDWFLANQEMLS